MARCTSAVSVRSSMLLTHRPNCRPLVCRHPQLTWLSTNRSCGPVLAVDRSPESFADRTPLDDQVRLIDCCARTSVHRLWPLIFARRSTTSRIPSFAAEQRHRFARVVARFLRATLRVYTTLRHPGLRTLCGWPLSERPLSLQMAANCIGSALPSRRNSSVLGAKWAMRNPHSKFLHRSRRDVPLCLASFRIRLVGRQARTHRSVRHRHCLRAALSWLLSGNWSAERRDLAPQELSFCLFGVVGYAANVLVSKLPPRCRVNPKSCARQLA